MVASKLIVRMSLVAAAIGSTAVLTFMALSASGNRNDLQLPFGAGAMMGEMMTKGSRMQMPAPEDVTILLESEYEMTTEKQSQVALKVLEKQTNEPVQGAEVIIGMEKGLPMTTMDMTRGGGTFDAVKKGNGTYTFTFTPESKGYYTVHTHVIPPGKQMQSMMENHADFIVLSK